MGGLGKTTLAKRVYDGVISRFNCHAWITVSQSYDRNEALQSLMDNFCPNKMSRSLTTGGVDVQRQMISKIREVLKNRRYVIVFDDVWREDFWIDIKHALLDNDMGGRIIVTTRNLDVLRSCGLELQARVYVHQLQPLPPEKAWQLFCLKASRSLIWQQCERQLEDYARQIVSRCQGLPLAIVTIAGLLSTKETIKEWQKLHDNLSSELDSNPQLTRITRILSLSYNEMPHHLKSCLLYLGIYPEGYLINCQRLIRQWVSEGFIIQEEKETLEQIAEEYLTELVNRSLVQTSRVSPRGKVKECRIHSLVHEMILKKAKHLQFGNYVSRYAGSFAEQGRRLSIGNTSLDVLGTIKNSRVRAVLIFNKLQWPKTPETEPTSANKPEARLANPVAPPGEEAGEIPGSSNIKISANFKLLKLLDLEYVSALAHLPEDIGSLFHLKYLSVAHTKVCQLPRSIGKLQNLETLDLRWSLVHDLPVEIKRLHKLRHLLAYRIDTKTDNFLAREGGVKLGKGVGSLASLQKLYYVESSNEIMAELRKLTQLRKLGIMELKTADGRNLCECIDGMEYLESLRVYTRSEDEIIDLDSLLIAPRCIQSLFLKGRLNKLPRWIGRLEILTKLELVGSRLNHDPTTVFRHLSNLMVLKYGDNSYDGERLDFLEGMFPVLQYLCFQHLSRLNSLLIEQGAMPFIEELSIEDCRQLRELPNGLQHLMTLRKISLVDMSEEFNVSLKPWGQRCQIIRHVSEVVSVREEYDLPTAEASTSGSH